MTVVDLWTDAAVCSGCHARTFAEVPWSRARAASLSVACRVPWHRRSPPSASRRDRVRAGGLHGRTKSDVLRRYFTNLDGPVFALVNLPEVVKGALFARYSAVAEEPAPAVPRRVRGRPRHQRRPHRRRHRRPAAGRGAATSRCSSSTATTRWPSSAACTWPASRRRTCSRKVLEWGRLMSYLEQSTRYIAYDARLGGRYRYYRDPACSAQPLRHSLRGRHGPPVRHLQPSCSARSPTTSGRRSSARADRLRLRLPPGDSGQGPRRRPRDAARGRRCPTSASTAPARRSRQLLLRMRAHPLPEARAYADLMLHELRKVIPSFLRRVDSARSRRRMERLPRRHPRGAPAEVVERLFGRRRRAEPAPAVALVDWDPDAEDKLLAAICYSHTAPARAPAARPGSRRSAPTSAGALLRAYVGDAGQPAPQAGPGLRAHRLPLRRALRLRRVPRPAAPPPAHHRVAAAHPAPRLRAARESIDDAGLHRRASTTPWQRSAALYDALDDVVPRAGAVRRVAMAYRPLRRCSSTPARRCTCWSCAPGRRATRPTGASALEMHRLIAEQAGHRAVARRHGHLYREEPGVGTVSESERRAEAETSSDWHHRRLGTFTGFVGQNATGRRCSSSKNAQGISFVIAPCP